MALKREEKLRQRAEQDLRALNSKARSSTIPAAKQRTNAKEFQEFELRSNEKFAAIVKKMQRQIENDALQSDLSLTNEASSAINGVGELNATSQLKAEQKLRVENISLGKQIRQLERQLIEANAKTDSLEQKLRVKSDIISYSLQAAEPAEIPRAPFVSSAETHADPVEEPAVAGEDKELLDFLSALSPMKRK